MNRLKAPPYSIQIGTPGYSSTHILTKRFRSWYSDINFWKSSLRNPFFLLHPGFILFLKFFKLVLGSARVGLIFIRSQEGTQPNGLTQTGPKNAVFDTMCHHAGCWRGELAGGRWTAAREPLGIRWWESCSSYSLLFVYSPYQYRCYCLLRLLFC